MQEALDNLKKQISSIKKVSPIPNDSWQKLLPRITVGLMAGGESSRFKEVTDANKNAFQLPDGDTMIEKTIRLYKEAGITDFVALVFHKGQAIEDLLKDGSDLGVNIRYSYDPGAPVGKGGAVKNALENGSVPKDNYLIIHNPDDVIIGYSNSFPMDIMSSHLEGEKEGRVATVVVVEGTPYPYTGMKISDNVVEQIEMYPIIPIPTHIGVTIFSPQTFEYFDKMFDYSKKSDFEKELFPVLSKERKLNAVSIPQECWIAVNNPKSYKELLKRLNLI